MKKEKKPFHPIIRDERTFNLSFYQEKSLIILFCLRWLCGWLRKGPSVGHFYHIQGWKELVLNDNITFHTNSVKLVPVIQS